jgi:TetR/AcrR family transcriptional regulator, cholesterol catabolism regulator
VTRKASSIPPRSEIGRRRIAAKSDSSEYYLGKVAALKTAAVTLFKEKGLKGTSLDDIAQLAGIDRSSLYYYVSSKKELYFETVRDAMDLVAQKLEAIKAGDGSPPEKLEAILVSLMDNYANHYPYLYVFLQEDFVKSEKAGSPQLKRLLSLSKRIERLVVEIIKAGIEDGLIRSDISPTIAAYAILGMTNWTHRWFNPAGRLTGREVGVEFGKIAIRGILRQ